MDLFADRRMGSLVRSALNILVSHPAPILRAEKEALMSHQNSMLDQPVETTAPQIHQTSPESTNGHDRLNDNPSYLNEKRLAAIELLAAGKTYTKAAKTLGIDRSTLFLWRRKPEFQERLQARIHELWGESTDRLKSMVEPSLEVMAEHLEDVYDRARFRAASLVLRLAKIGTINERAM